MLTSIACLVEAGIFPLLSRFLVRSIAAAAICILLWRLYRFTLQPALWPSEPRERPYWIPLLGHLVSFLSDNNGTTFNGDSRCAYLLTLMGTGTVFVTSEKDAANIHQNPAHFTHDPTLKHVLRCFGMSAKGISTFWAKSLNDKPLAHRCAAILAQEFSPGGTEQSLQNVLTKEISNALLWQSKDFEPSTQGGNNVRIVSLTRLSRSVYATAFAKSFFGDSIFNISPEFLQDLYVFDEKSWMPIYGATGPWSHDMARALENIQKALVRYVQLPESHRPDGSGLMKKMEKTLREGGMEDADIASYISMIYWGANTNIWKASFWFLGHLVHNPSLLSEIQAETTPVMSEKSHLNLTSRLRACPKFMSIFHEMLRISTASASSREATRDFTLGEGMDRSQIRQGTRVAIMYRHMQMCKNTFGHDADVFRANRFLEQPDLAKSPNFNPFGGGPGVCPGRYLAQTGVLTFVAHVLSRYKIELADRSATMPLIDTKTPPIGTMYSIGKKDIVLRVERR